eukprot:6174301-Pleurochrysis_carterae.AAC.1
MDKKYEESLGKSLLLLLRAYDKYRDWRETLDIPTTREPSDRQRAALRMAIAAVKLAEIFDEVADGNGKTKMFHIISYIIPRYTGCTRVCPIPIFA